MCRKLSAREKLTILDQEKSQQPLFRTHLPRKSYPLVAKASIQSVLCEKATYRMRFSQVTKTPRANIVSRGSSPYFLRLTKSVASEARLSPPGRSCARTAF